MKKNKQRVFAVIVLAAVIGLGFISCETLDSFLNKGGGASGGPLEGTWISEANEEFLLDVGDMEYTFKGEDFLLKYKGNNNEMGTFVLNNNNTQIVLTTTHSWGSNNQWNVNTSVSKTRTYNLSISGNTAVIFNMTYNKQ